MSVEYLAMCNLDFNAIFELMNMCEELNSSCVKYLINCYINGQFDWYEKFYDLRNHMYGDLIYFICRHARTEIVIYILKIYDENNLGVNRISNGYTLIYILCQKGNTAEINYMLDIYVKKNLDLEMSVNGRVNPLMDLCYHGKPQTIKRIFDIYIEKKLNLNCVIYNGLGCINLLDENRVANYGLKKNTMQMYFLSLEKDVFTSESR